MNETRGHCTANDGSAAPDIKLLQELAGNSDRAAAVLGHAMVEEFIRSMVSAALAGSEKHKIVLIGSDESAGVLGFANQCRLAHGLELVDRDELSDLLLIARIRNRFSHSAKPLSFEDRVIVDRCTSLKTYKDIDPLTKKPGQGMSIAREIYTRCVYSLMLRISNRRQRQCKRLAKSARKKQRKLEAVQKLLEAERPFIPSPPSLQVRSQKLPRRAAPGGSSHSTPPAVP